MSDAAFSELIGRVKERIDIVQIVGEHVVLRKQGASFVGLCPFHQERSPSLSVHPQKQFYHCYGCKKGGDVLNFLVELLGISFLEALHELAERAGIPLPTGSAKSSTQNTAQLQRRREEAMGYKLNRFTATFYHHHLLESLEGEDARRYLLESRGLSLDTIKTFYLGVSPVGWNPLHQHLQAGQAPLDLAQTLGLVRQSQNGSWFDHFHGRIVMPVLNARGKISGFGGRIWEAPAPGAAPPKYLNSPESHLFQKSTLAFGLYQARKYIREQAELIVVEGYFDALSLWEVGIRNVVATCGTALSSDLLEALCRLASKVIVLFDGDAAGHLATDKAMELGLAQGHVLYGAEMPEGVDPDQWARATPFQQIREFLDQSAPLIDKKINILLDHALRDAESQSLALKELGSLLGGFSDPLGRRVRLAQIQKRLDLSEGFMTTWIESWHLHSSIRPSASASGQVIKRQAKPVKLPSRDLILVKGILDQHPAWIRFRADPAALPPQIPLSGLFTHPDAIAWAEADFVEQLEGLNALEMQTDGAAKSAQSRRQMREIVTEHWAQNAQNPSTNAVDAKKVPSKTMPTQSSCEFTESLSLAVRQCWTRYSRQISNQLRRASAPLSGSANSETAAELHASLTQQYLDVQRKMKELNKSYDKD